MGRDAFAAIVFVVPLVAAWAFSATRLVLQPFHVPAEADYQQARVALVRQGYQPGRDAWAVSPAWSLRAWQHLGDLHPISGDHLAQRPLRRYARVFVLEEPDGDVEVRALRKRLGPPAEVASMGRLKLHRFELGNLPPAYDFSENVEHAQIRIIDTVTGQATPCEAHVRGGKSCPSGNPWQRVTRQWLLVSENGDKVVWSHPPPRPNVLEIAFEGVTLGPELIIRAGHTRDSADRARGEVRLHVEVDGREVGVVCRRPAFDFRVDQLDTRGLPGTRPPGRVLR
jgi:hypothetical protein